MRVGAKAPAFRLKDKEGNLHSLKDFKESTIVLYFYPKDNTPGCTVEAVEFNKLLGEFKKQNAIVIGISGGNEKSKTKFCSEHSLNFPLLSDEDFSVAKSFHCYGEKSFMGRKFQGIFRQTYILDKSRKIVHIYEKVTPLTHPQEVLHYLKTGEVLQGKVTAPAKAAPNAAAKKPSVKGDTAKKGAPKKTTSVAKKASSKKKASAAKR